MFDFLFVTLNVFGMPQFSIENNIVYTEENVVSSVMETILDLILFNIFFCDLVMFQPTINNVGYTDDNTTFPWAV